MRSVVDHNVVMRSMTLSAMSVHLLFRALTKVFTKTADIHVSLSTGMTFHPFHIKEVKLRNEFHRHVT